MRIERHLGSRESRDVIKFVTNEEDSESMVANDSVKIGDKFVIEVEEIIPKADGEVIYKMKNFNTLIFDKQGIEKLDKYKPEKHYIPTFSVRLVPSFGDLPKYSKKGSVYIVEATKELYSVMTSKPAQYMEVNTSADLNSFIYRGQLSSKADLPADGSLGDFYVVTSTSKPYVCVESCICEYAEVKPLINQDN